MHTSHTVPCTVFMVLALVVETLDRTIHRKNHYPDAGLKFIQMIALSTL